MFTSVIGWFLIFLFTYLSLWLHVYYTILPFREVEKVSFINSNLVLFSGLRFLCFDGSCFLVYLLIHGEYLKLVLCAIVAFHQSLMSSCEMDLLLIPKWLISILKSEVALSFQSRHERHAIHISFPFLKLVTVIGVYDDMWSSLIS